MKSIEAKYGLIWSNRFALLIAFYGSFLIFIGAYRWERLIAYPTKFVVASVAVFTLILYSLYKNRNSARKLSFNEDGLLITPWVSKPEFIYWSGVESWEKLSGNKAANGYRVPEIKFTASGGKQYYISLNFPKCEVLVEKFNLA